MVDPFVSRSQGHRSKQSCQRAKHTPEVSVPPGTLLPVGRDYSFEPGKVYNLNADEFIMDHGDVAGHRVAYAFLNTVLKV